MDGRNQVEAKATCVVEVAAVILSLLLGIHVHCISQGSIPLKWRFHLLLLSDCLLQIFGALSDLMTRLRFVLFLDELDGTLLLVGLSLGMGVLQDLSADMFIVLL